jgi:hypothetical protein
VLRSVLRSHPVGQSSLQRSTSSRSCARALPIFQVDRPSHANNHTMPGSVPDSNRCRVSSARGLLLSTSDCRCLVPKKPKECGSLMNTMPSIKYRAPRLKPGTFCMEKEALSPRLGCNCPESLRTIYPLPITGRANGKSLLVTSKKSSYAHHRAQLQGTWSIPTP